jgi:hypothetical protein
MSKGLKSAIEFQQTEACDESLWAGILLRHPDYKPQTLKSPCEDEQQITISTSNNGSSALNGSSTT